MPQATPELRPASANPPLGSLWPATPAGLLFDTGSSCGTGAAAHPQQQRRRSCSQAPLPQPQPPGSLSPESQTAWGRALRKSSVYGGGRCDHG
eukprot:scaffold71933_cov50-Phaeocystis_antarctica.AAC.1